MNTRFLGLRRMAALGSAISLSLALGIAGGSPALAGSGVPGSQECNDNPLLGGDDIPVLGGTAPGVLGSAPVTLGVESGILNGGSVGHLMVCYSLSSYGFMGPELSGGAYAIDVLNPPGVLTNPGNHTIDFSCWQDANTQTLGFFCVPAGADLSVPSLLGVVSQSVSLANNGPFCVGALCPLPSFFIRVNATTVGDVFVSTITLPLAVPGSPCIKFNFGPC